ARLRPYWRSRVKHIVMNLASSSRAASRQAPRWSPLASPARERGWRAIGNNEPGESPGAALSLLVTDDHRRFANRLLDQCSRPCGICWIEVAEGNNRHALVINDVKAYAKEVATIGYRLHPSKSVFHRSLRSKKAPPKRG